LLADNNNKRWNLIVGSLQQLILAEECLAVHGAQDVRVLHTDSEDRLWPSLTNLKTCGAGESGGGFLSLDKK
jgi:hypothetical protein